MKDRELKDREVKIKRETEELFFKPIIVSKDDMDRFEKKEMKKIRPISMVDCHFVDTWYNTWYYWLMNYIPGHIRKSVGGFKDKIVSLFKTNTPRQTLYWRGKKQNIRNPFILKKKKRN